MNIDDTLSDDYPDCPRCETDVLVAGNGGSGGYICYGCDTTFDA